MVELARNMMINSEFKADLGEAYEVNILAINNHVQCPSIRLISSANRDFDLIRESDGALA